MNGLCPKKCIHCKNCTYKPAYLRRAFRSVETNELAILVGLAVI